MILLEFHNRILRDTLEARLVEGAKPEACDITMADFDGVMFHLSTPESKSKVLVSISIKCFAELQKHGADAYLKEVYGDMICAPEQGYDFSVAVDSEKPPANREEALEKVSMLKRHCLAAPFAKFFDLAEKGGSDERAVIAYRHDETLYISAEKDRVTVIFSTVFKDDDDVVIGKVFMQEFQDARRNVQNAPQVLFTHRDPPAELANTNAATGDNIGYVSFVIFARHYSLKGGNREKTIDLIQTFRDYLHYHIKCSKAYLHQRMRSRVSMLLKVLNRARPEVEKEKKTASGKTFRRKV